MISNEAKIIKERQNEVDHYVFRGVFPVSSFGTFTCRLIAAPHCDVKLFTDCFRHLLTATPLRGVITKYGEVQGVQIGQYRDGTCTYNWYVIFEFMVPTGLLGATISCIEKFCDLWEIGEEFYEVSSTIGALNLDVDKLHDDTQDDPDRLQEDYSYNDIYPDCTQDVPF